MIFTFDPKFCRRYFLSNFQGASGGGILFPAFIHHHFWKLPESSQKSLGLIPVKQIPAVSFHQGNGPGFFPGFSGGLFLFQKFTLRRAELQYRAGGAPGRRGDADRGAQVHQGLVEVGSPAQGNPPLQEFFQVLLGRGTPGMVKLRKETLEDTLHVSVEGSNRLVEGQAGHGPGGVRTEAREAEKFLLRPGDFSAQIPADGLRRPVKIPGPRVISQSGPGLKNLLPRGTGQISQCWEKGQEALVIGDDRLHPGLLEHELRDQDPVRVPIPAPGELSSMGRIPPEKSPLESGLLREIVSG